MTRSRIGPFSSCSSISRWASSTSPPHRFADLAAGSEAHFSHGLLETLDLDLRLLDVQLNALAQRFGARLSHRPLHTAERLLLRAVGVLQFLSKQFKDFRFHSVSFWPMPITRGIANGAVTRQPRYRGSDRVTLLPTLVASGTGKDRLGRGALSESRACRGITRRIGPCAGGDLFCERNIRTTHFDGGQTVTAIDGGPGGADAPSLVWLPDLGQIPSCMQPGPCGGDCIEWSSGHSRGPRCGSDGKGHPPPARTNSRTYGVDRATSGWANQPVYALRQSRFSCQRSEGRPT
jgi:hypothetical protein